VAKTSKYSKKKQKKRRILVKMKFLKSEATFGCENNFWGRYASSEPKIGFVWNFWTILTFCPFYAILGLSTPLLRHFTPFYAISTVLQKYFLKISYLGNLYKKFQRPSSNGSEMAYLSKIRSKFNFNYHSIPLNGHRPFWGWPTRRA
jgi:hypothetical protein